MKRLDGILYSRTSRVIRLVTLAFVLLSSNANAKPPEEPGGKEPPGQERSTQRQLDKILAKLDSIEESLKPCTIERWWNCECDFRDPEIKVCVKVGLEAAAGLEWALEPATHIDAGGGWDELPQLEVKREVTLPFILTGLVIPTAKVAGEVSVAGDVTICLPGLTLDRRPGLRCRAFCADGEACDVNAQDCADGSQCIKQVLIGACADCQRCDAKKQDCADQSKCIRTRHIGQCNNETRCSQRIVDDLRCSDDSTCLSDHSCGGTIGAPGLEPFEEFQARLVEAAEEKRDQILDSMTAVLQDKQLTPDRLVEPLNKLRGLKANVEGVDDPAGILQKGPLRELIDVLPPIDGRSALLDDPTRFIPSVDPGDPLVVCRDLGDLEFIGPTVNKICDFVVNDMPDFARLAETIEDIVGNVEDALCKTSAVLECGNVVRDCRQDCRSDFNNCKEQCGNRPLTERFGCNKDCREQNRDCKQDCG